MTEQNSKPEAHSDIVGGSTAGRVIACPGSVQLNQAVKRAQKERILNELIEARGLAPSLTLGNMPENVAAAVEGIYREETTSEYADEGTACHSAIAWILENDEEPESVVDRTFDKHIMTPTLYSEAIAPALKEFDDYCDRVFEEDGEDLEFVIEKECQIPGIPGAFGTSDIIGKTSKRIVIWDWKFGAGVAVSAFDNKQVKFYGRGACYTMKEWLGFAEGAAQPPADLRVDLVICQPRIGEGKYDLWSTTYGDLEEFRGELIAAVAEAQSADPKVKRGDHCRWCDAKHVCPAKQQLGQRILQRVDDAAGELAEDIGDEAFDMAAAAVLKAREVQFTPDDLAEWLRDAADIKDWCDWVQSLAFEELKAGRGPSNMELEQGLGNAAWTVDEKTVDRRLASYGLSVDDRRNVKPISPTQARKEVKKLGSEKHMKLLEKIIDRPPAAMRMVPKGTAKNPVKPVSEKVAALRDKLKEYDDAHSED